MKTRFFSYVRNGMLALGVAAGLSVPAAAAPLSGPSRTAIAPAAAEADTMQIHYRRYNRRYDCYRFGGCGYYGRRNDWRYRYYRPYRHYNPGIYLGLGVPIYRYYAQPRRYYRDGGSAHVRWCYDRYRSYRAWDNTYQPYHGPRRQCWSPYS
ncbi:BA14K family protein [Mesorhizobium sp. KR9-304]|uniref:BA14K family protein n=1 Tax=Mesorhizobium sp. KR9-304 TaxID=3156614 RepID=UPI0032B37EF5